MSWKCISIGEIWLIPVDIPNYYVKFEGKVSAIDIYRREVAKNCYILKS